MSMVEDYVALSLAIERKESIDMFGWQRWSDEYTAGKGQWATPATLLMGMRDMVVDVRGAIYAAGMVDAVWEVLKYDRKR